jgi:hypothetical protein
MMIHLQDFASIVSLNAELASTFLTFMGVCSSMKTIVV